MNTSRTISNNTIINSAITSFDESKIIWAIIASILLHVLLAVGVPNFKSDDIKKEHQVLKIEIQNTVLPPVIVPQPPVIEPKPIPKLVKPKKPKPKIKPILDPIAKPIEPFVPEEPAEPTPPIMKEVIAVESTLLPKPDVMVVSQPPPKLVKPTQVAIYDALGQYSSLLGRSIAKHKYYPKIARKRGWQGKVILDLRIDGSGNILSAKVQDSSGHAILDKEALKMAEKAAPFPKPPLALQSQIFNITVPVSFKLSSG